MVAPKSPSCANHGSVTALVRRFFRDASGATAVEYALMTTFIATVIVAAVVALGSRLNALFTEVSSAF